MPGMSIIRNHGLFAKYESNANRRVTGDSENIVGCMVCKSQWGTKAVVVVAELGD